MRIYKFRDLTDEEKHPHFYQIVLQNLIWCAKPDSLNDDDEFKFELDYRLSSHTAGLLSQIVAKYRTTNYRPPDLSVSSVLQRQRLEPIMEPIVRGVIDKCRNTIGVASFSATKTDDHLWNEYGGKGNGACIEIEIPDTLINESFHPVYYVSEKVFHIDSFLRSGLFPDQADQEYETFKNMLLTKTRRWSREQEVRFISKRQEVNLILDGRIKEITLGVHIPTRTMEQVEASITEHCNTKGIRITKL